MASTDHARLAALIENLIPLARQDAENASWRMGPDRRRELLALKDEARILITRLDKGRAAYEADLVLRPNYPHNGQPRVTWADLGTLERSTWEK
jgi:hypothetical protein